LAFDGGGNGPATASWFVLAFLSGFLVLGLEILALHQFSQVLHNSTYTFATVLVVVILALSVGALVTQRLSLSAQRAWHLAGLVVLLGAVWTALLPRLFFVVTDGMSPFSAGGSGLTLYVVRILGVGALTLGPAFILLGWVFPLILAGRGSSAGGSSAGGGSARDEAGRPSIGRQWGLLLAINAVGALLGMALVNHVTMQAMGLWMSFVLWCLVMLVAGVLVAWQSSGRMRWVLWGLPIFVGASLAWSNPRDLPQVRIDAGEHLVAWSAGADGIAAVLERIEPYRDTRIKWNNTYSLGGASNAAQQMRLGFIPLLLHPHPRNVAFIGMATGITAGAGLRDPLEPRVTTVELSPQIAALSCEYFNRLSANLCTNERSRVIVEDGRMFFHSTRDTFDVVVGDLFVPWRAGVANLFTREHFHSVKARLREEGLYAQWLPLFQMDETAFWGIVATFLESFPNAWLAVADFQPYNAAVALIGWKQPQGGPSWADMQRRTHQLGSQRTNRDPVLRSAEGLGLFLVGPLAGKVPAGTTLMTEDRPWLGTHAARVERMRPPPMFQGRKLVNVLQSIASGVPPGPVRESVITGQLLYQFCGIVESQGPEIGTQWLDANLDRPLPSVLATPRLRRWSWPFPPRAGQILVRRALEESRER
jgi:spermidine synthase